MLGSYCNSCGDSISSEVLHNCSIRFCAVCGIRFSDGEGKPDSISYDNAKVYAHPGCIPSIRRELLSQYEYNRMTDSVKDLVSKVYYDFFGAIDALASGRSIVVHDFHKDGKLAYCYWSEGAESKTKVDGTFVAVLTNNSIRNKNSRLTSVEPDTTNTVVSQEGSSVGGAG